MAKIDKCDNFENFEIKSNDDLKLALTESVYSIKISAYNNYLLRKYAEEKNISATDLVINSIFKMMKNDNYNCTPLILNNSYFINNFENKFNKYFEQASDIDRYSIMLSILKNKDSDILNITEFLIKNLFEDVSVREVRQLSKDCLRYEGWNSFLRNLVKPYKEQILKDIKDLL